jgi:putative transposase
MPSGLKRVYGKGDLHFVTFSCFERRPLLYSAEARNLLVHELDMVRRKTNFRLIGYVVMPNHVHLLISEPLTGTVSTVLHKLKLGFSRKIRKEKRAALHGQMQLPLCQRETLPRAFWQSRFYDFNVHSHGKRKEKLIYMHANPVTRRLVSHPRDWPWSSWSFYATGEAGLIRIDGD